MYNMYGCLFLLALLIIPSALQQQTKTVDQKVVDLAGWLQRWKTLSTESQALIIEGQVTKEDLGDALKEVVAEAVGVRAQLEELLVDFAELVKIAQVTRNVTSQFLTDLQVLKGRQAVSGAVQGGQVFMFVAYLVTIAVLCLVKHCNKHRERLAQSEFELLEAKLQSNKAKRRAAAARARAQPEITSQPNPSWK